MPRRNTGWRPGTHSLQTALMSATPPVFPFPEGKALILILLRALRPHQEATGGICRGVLGSGCPDQWGPLTSCDPSPVPEELGSVLGAEMEASACAGASFPAQPSESPPCPEVRPYIPSPQAGWMSPVQSLWVCLPSSLPSLHPEGAPSSTTCCLVPPFPSSPVPSPILPSPSGWPHGAGNTRAQLCLSLCGMNR